MSVWPLEHASRCCLWRHRNPLLPCPPALQPPPLLPAGSPTLPPSALAAQWSLALPALALAGASDWLDGYMAKHYSRPSVVGSYLDPLADKVLVGSVVAALGWSVSAMLWRCLWCLD